MGRSRGRPAPRRAPPSRGAHTQAAPPPPARAAPPPAAQAPPAAAQQGPGMMGTMASSMAGAMAGSVIGHGISNAMFGGSEQAPAEQQYDSAPVQQQAQGGMCGGYQQQLMQCLNENQGNIQACQWAADMLKQCSDASGGR